MDEQRKRFDEIEARVASRVTTGPVTFADLSRQIARLQAHVESEFGNRETEGNTTRNIAALDRMLRGHNGDPGIVTRLALLEESERNRKWTIRAVLGGLITLVVDRLWSVFTGTARH